MRITPAAVRATISRGHSAERDRVDVDREPGGLHRQPLGGDERDGAEERDARAIQREPRQLAEQHAHVDENEDRENDRIHG